jgi:hypothetical protein
VKEKIKGDNQLGLGLKNQSKEVLDKILKWHHIRLGTGGYEQERTPGTFNHRTDREGKVDDYTGFEKPPFHPGLGIIAIRLTFNGETSAQAVSFMNTGEDAVISQRAGERIFLVNTGEDAVISQH